VGDVEGSLEVPQSVETTIEPDFSAGDMLVIPEAGQVFSKVTVNKPYNLTPEIIPKDVTIAGIVGTMESGGASEITMPCVLIHAKASTFSRYYGSSTLTMTVGVYAYVTKGSVPVWAYFDANYVYTSSSSNAQNLSIKLIPIDLSTLTITTGTTYDTIHAYENIKENAGYKLEGAVLVLGYTIPGLSIKVSSDGIYTAYADSSFESFYTTSDAYGFATPVHVVDFSESTLSALTGYAFRRMSDLRTIRFPATITSIASYAIENCNSLAILDFSKCVAVPSLASTPFGMSGLPSSCQILVPSALYDQWKVATNWSGYSNRIVPV